MAIHSSEFNKIGASPFPKDNVSPSIKEGKSYGVEIARAIWGYASMHNTHLFYGDRDNYKIYRDFALGRQDKHAYKTLLNEDKGGKQTDWLRAINYDIKNYATKRINITVAKMFAKDYDVVVDMIDPMSKGMMENIKRTMQLKMKHKAKLKQMDEILGKEDFKSIPDNQEELDIIMDTDFKMIEAAHLEKAIPYHLAKNRYEDIRALIDFDLAVLGVAAIYTGMDENLRPYIERVNPSDIIAPYNETPNFEDLPYISRVKWVTGSEFRKMAVGYLSDKRINEIIEEFSKTDHTTDHRTEHGGSDNFRHDDVAKIALLHYNYKSTDTMVFLEKDDIVGNKKMFKKDINYYARPKEMDKFKQEFGDSRTIHRKSINAVYEGFWVIGSEKDVFRHGRRAYSLENNGVFNGTGMGFKVFAPNSWDGVITSMGSQMIPVLHELQRYNLKIQQLVARAIPKGIGIDLYALRKANLQWGGKSLSDQEKIEMFMKSGIFAFSSKDRYAAGSNYRPFYEVENGLANDIDKYLLLTQTALNQLDEIIGINKVVAASNVREDAGKAVTELQVGASEVALDYLYKADRKIFNQVVQDLGKLHVQSYRYNKQNQMAYNAMFGQGAMAQEIIRFDLFDYAFTIEVRPTAAEWQDIYLGADKAYDKGIISYSDTLFLREFKSIKQARLWLIIKEKRAVEAAKASKQEDIQANANVQQQSLLTKSQEDQKLERLKNKNLMDFEAEKRKTLAFESSLLINREQKMLVMQSEFDRRENAQEGKIKDRHIDGKGEFDVEVAEISADSNTSSAPSKEK